MIGKIVVSKDDIFDSNYSIYYDLEYGYVISISTDLDLAFEDLITNYGALEKSIDEEISFSKLNDSEYVLENLQFLKKCKGNSKKILDNVEYVEFNFSLDEILLYLKKNPCLKNKKIILNESLGLDLKTLEKISNELGGNIENLYFKLIDNNRLVSFDECKKTYQYLENVCNEIKKFDFSPMEKIMYVYDLVRSRIYIDTGCRLEDFVSRDLTSVLFGNKIVCLGYARLMDSLLKMLDINTRVVYLYDNEYKSGHARNEIYVKDDKYGIDGVYYFDATWDSKKSEENDDYLLSYRYFAMTKEQVDEYDDGKIVDSKIPCCSLEMIEKVINIIKNEGITKIPKDLVDTINHMSYAVNASYLINVLEYFGIKNVDEEKIISKLFEIYDCFDRPILANTFLEVLYNVRSVQYYLEPSKYPFDVVDFYKTVLLSDWYFDGRDSYEKLIFAILDGVFKPKDIEYMDQYDEDTGLSKNIEQVKLVRTLRRVYEKKDNENS